ncbi:MAG: hypothetical protein QNK89_05150 [Lacinutrix sp.]
MQYKFYYPPEASPAPKLPPELPLKPNPAITPFFHNVRFFSCVFW